MCVFVYHITTDGLRMNPRYNLALIPKEESVKQTLFDSAKHLTPYADEYCLNQNNALPHITLSQFRAKDDETAKKMVADFLKKKEISVISTGIYIQSGQEKRSGKFWIGHIITREKSLIDLQEKIILALTKNGAEVLTAARDNYSPHLTLARLNALPPSLTTNIYPQTLINHPIPCQLHLGASDETGRFLTPL